MRQRKAEILSKYNKRESFLQAYNPDLQMKICKDKIACFVSTSPNLRELNVSYGDMTAAIWLTPQLYNLSEFCGCKEKLTGNSLKECAHVIASEFAFLKVTELMLFFYWFKSGKYGKFYGSVDPLTITLSLRTFLDERVAILADIRRKEEDRIREEGRKNAISREEYLR